MKLDATPDTLRAVAKALQRAGFLDDRMGQPDKARIAAWAEQIQPYRFTEDDMLDGVSRYYSGPVDRAMGIGDLIHHSKLSRIDRTSSESRQEREARQAALDAAKVDPEILALARVKAIPEEEPRYTRQGMGAKTVACPWCKARASQPCVIPGTADELKRGLHPARTEAWETSK